MMLLQAMSDRTLNVLSEKHLRTTRLGLAERTKIYQCKIQL